MPDKHTPAARAATYQKHYFRICRLHAGPCYAGMRKNPGRRVDEIGIKATVKLREIFRDEPKPGMVEALTFTGARWASGFGTFEDRVAAIGSPVLEGAMFRAQAAA